MKKKNIMVLLVLSCLLLTSCANTQKAQEYKSLQDFQNKKIGVQSGTLYEDHVYKKISDAEVELFTDPNAMLLSLSLGKLDAYVTDESAIGFERKQYPELKLIDEPLAVVPVGIGIGETPRKELLTKQMNDFIANAEKNGTLSELKTYWIENCDEDNNVTDRSNITGENGQIIVAMEGAYVPFSYINGQVSEGYDVDFIYRFCREYGYEPVFELMEYDALSPALSTGKCDLATNIIYDEERKEQVTLTSPYYNSVIVLGYFGNVKAKAFTIDNIIDGFEKTFIKDSRWMQFASGALVTLIISTFSILLGTIFGLILYIICRNKGKLINLLVDKISWLVEGTPTVLLLMIFYFIIFGNVNIEKIIVAVVVFTIIFTVSMFSMLTSGEKAVGPGQLEAALSQGFSEFAAYILIILPQSAIHFLPQYCDEVVSLIKETSIVGYIAILDLTKVSDMIRGRTFEPFFPLIFTTVIYFLLSWLLTIGVKKLLRSLSPATRDLDEVFRDIKR